MTSSRRTVLTGAACLPLLAMLGITRTKAGTKTMDEIDPNAPLYGLIGQINAKPGHRDELVQYLLESSADMPGNLAYLVAKDAENADSIWITEIWKDEASHHASLKLPQVQAAIAKARPILAGFGTSAKVIPVGGKH